jgi:hypothetical protein
MAALLACSLLRCCGDTAEQDDYVNDPPSPAVPRCHVQTAPCTNSIYRQQTADASAAQHAGIGVLDADVLLLILARCELQDLAGSARVRHGCCLSGHAVLCTPHNCTGQSCPCPQAVCSLWRDLADQAALTAFIVRWGLRSIVGKPRHPAALAVSLAHHGCCTSDCSAAHVVLLTISRSSVGSQ